MKPFGELAIKLDPSLLMEAVGWQPDEWQRRLLQRRFSQLLLNCSRQAGKSTVIACMAMVEALVYAPALILIICPALRQSKEFIRTLQKICKAIGERPSNESTTHLEFRNGSRIMAVPDEEQNIRGISAVSLLVLDEAARIPDDLYNSVLPMLAVSNGRIAIMSTPFGKRGFFHKEWTEGLGWERVKVTAEECPRIKPSFLAKQRCDLGPIFFRQEYMCEFAELTNSVFTFEDVQAAMSDDVKPLFSAPEGLESDTVKPLFQ